MPTMLVQVLALTLAAAVWIPAAGQDGLFYGEDVRKPADLTPELLCESCHAVLETVENQVGKTKRTESAIYDVMENICDMRHFKRYKFIPPEMLTGCQHFLKRYGDDGLEEQIFKNKPGTPGYERICRAACKGVTYKDPDALAEEARKQQQRRKRSRRRRRRRRSSSSEEDL
eukprot:TRINITY_DN41143_c0_g1_i1.p1 TRINITY_DN41143_c0_g1~~TRINITY_DN41143_c0_g1_i1.p1  ORF type:complete len:172 (-),score=43.07 TRINITY_DN41143_c0_g1_i1:27-542(-)